MPAFDFSQAVGLIGFLVGSSAFIHQDDHRFRLHLATFQVILCSHFILMGAITAAFGCGISALRSYISTKTQSSYVMWGFIVLLWGLGLVNTQKYYEILTILGASLVTWGLFKVGGLTLRYLILFNSFCWLTNNLLLGSIGGSLMEVTFILINTYTITKIWEKERTSH